MNKLKQHGELYNFKTNRDTLGVPGSAPAVSASGSCVNVSAYVFPGVVDNFAAVENQVPWYTGQRYWINKQFWGGKGSPIFVYIGGENL